MKKFLFILFLFSFLILPVEAKATTIKVVALENFSTEFPLESFNVQTIETERFKNGIVLEEGTILAGKVTKIEKPKRGRRDARFEFVPTHISYNGKTKTLKEPMFVAQVIGYTPIDTEKLVISAAKTTAGFFVKGISQGISFTQGLVEAEEGERLKSGFVRMYKDSPLSFIDVGDELKIDIGDVLLLKLRKINEEELDNSI